MGRRLLAAGLLVPALVAGVAPPARAQEEGESLLERLNLDRLQLAALGASFGVARPAMSHSAGIYELHAEYGEIVPNWRVVFTAAFWHSRYRDEEVRRLVEVLERSLDPPGGAEIRPSRVTVSDIALGAEGRWTPLPSAFASPWLGLGLSAHVINTEGRLISGTFIENSLDYITAGIAGGAGVNLRVLDQLSLGAQARYDLLSGLRYGSLRVSGTYIFGPLVRRGTP